MINDDFEEFAVGMDSDCVCDDFDNYDLYGERMEGDNNDDFYGYNIEFE